VKCESSIAINAKEGTRYEIDIRNEKDANPVFELYSISSPKELLADSHMICTPNQSLKNETPETGAP